ncbi:hypothetical protein ATI61_102705 [Archangium gephyra]|uniref:Glycine zipper domain-containing protein n=1 Tax=Archangium gephyra TaxID=48 RepID=A0AAC8QDC5_9BACT|nr:hypothetical protein [Archangium gephyra]AKJ05647.1 Hypothetical protein AA314_07273 [Archangium gephyra]REG36328.1 hypothetical protein ATI61_102705 [Archangium gephyra]
MLRTLFRPSLLLACVLASGCGPSAVEPKPTANQDTQAQALRIRIPRWLKIVVSDMVGAASGAQTGAEIGGILGPEGAAAGAVIGGIIGGVQASTEAAARQTTTLGVSAGSKPSSDPANARNPFDHIGQHHNAVLDTSVGIIGPGGCIPNPFPFPFPRDRTQGPLWDYSLKTLNAPPELMKLPELEASWHKTLDFVVSVEQAEDLELAIADGVKSGLLTPPVGERLISYVNTVAPLDTDKLLEVTKAIEEETLADKELGEQDRQSLLSAYSVARHSAAYWGEQAAQQESSPWCGCSK